MSKAGLPGSLFFRSAALAALFFVVGCGGFAPEIIVSPPASTSVAAPRTTSTDIRPSLDSPSAPVGSAAASGPPAVFTADTPIPPRPGTAAGDAVEVRGAARQDCLRTCNRDNDRCADSYSSRRSADSMVGGAGLIGSGVDMSGSAGCAGSLGRCLSRCNSL